MIKLEAIHIEEVRGIRRMDINVDRSTYAISGPNGSGKSEIIDAMEFQAKRLGGFPPSQDDCSGSLSKRPTEGSPTAAVSISRRGPITTPLASETLSAIWRRNASYRVSLDHTFGGWLC